MKIENKKVEPAMENILAALHGIDAGEFSNDQSARYVATNVPTAINQSTQMLARLVGR